MGAPRTDLRAVGDRDLAARILREPGVGSAIERYEKLAEEAGARRQLLATALRRAQVIRDLCVIVRADGAVTEAETRILFEIADAVGVDRALVSCSVGEAPDAHVPARPEGGFPAAPGA